MKTKILIFLSILTLNLSNSYSQDPQKIIANIKKQLSSVKDFQANINVKIDISFLNAPEQNGKIYYKAPNKTKIDIPGFAMLPKQGSGNFINDIIFDNNSTIVYVGKEELNKMPVTSIKIIPTDANNDLALANLWVDETRNVVMKVETITKKNGTFMIFLDYSNIEGKIWMPSKVLVSLNVPEFSLPKTMSGDTSGKEKKKKGNTEGKVTFTYSNYIVNKGIDDKIFSTTLKK
jgi:outer membrane lipoprotein-sorting protein